MHAATLARRGLTHHWRTHAAVVAGVAIAVAVLSGALLVGASVRESLRELALLRLGRTHYSVTAPRWFRVGLADDVARQGAAACALVKRDGLLERADRGPRAAGIAVYGVDDTFWSFHRRARHDLAGGDVLLSAALAAELESRPGTELMLRLDAPPSIPGSLLFGRRDAPGRSLRLTVRGTLTAGELGEFSLRPQPQAARSVFLSLATVQRALDQDGRANVLLIGDTLAAADLLKRAATLEDLGVRLRALPERNAVAVETRATLLDDALAREATAAAETLRHSTTRVLVYLATSIRAGPRSIPYSLVAAADAPWMEAVVPPDAHLDDPPILLNEWAARDLGVRAGDPITLDYDVWNEEAGRIDAGTSTFTLAAVVPLAGPAGDRDLAPEYPGITDRAQLDDWDPPFPLDLKRIRPQDEEYWKRHRTTPKAFVPLAAGQRLWRHRLGDLTSLRVSGAGEAYARTLRERLDPARYGLVVEPVRAAALDAADGATDFGMYFVAFSTFLVASALLLAGLFFRLGVEQREREIGLLRAVGFSAARVRTLFLAEGAALSAAGALVGAAGAVAYAFLIVFGLRTTWRGAVGLEHLQVHVDLASLAGGVVAGMAIAVFVLLLSLRVVARLSPRRLLAGSVEPPRPRASRRALVVGLVSSTGGVALVIAAARGAIPAPAAFFASGALLLGATIAFAWRGLARPPRSLAGLPSLYALGRRQAAHRPGRSLLCGALLAGAVFVIVAAGAFRHGARAPSDRRSSSGGYALVAESVAPLHHDPSSAEGREALGLVGPGEDALAGVEIARFRLRPGDDASCLNVYRPQDARILGATRAFLQQGRFSFQQSLATTPEERANPWLLLEADRADVAIPAIADANSLAYVLHRQVGDELIVGGSVAPVRLKIVGALRSGLLQGELIVSERAFVRVFPQHEGYRFFLIDAPAGREAAVASWLESRLVLSALDVSPSAERLARYHRVENTYISVFQMLGGLGLLLGTVGLATVLLRNALERRRETALLRAVGYRRRDIVRVALAENLLVLVGGLLAGTACALVAALPALIARGGDFPYLEMLALLALVLVSGIVALRVAVALVVRGPLLAALRTE